MHAIFMLRMFFFQDCKNRLIFTQPYSQNLTMCKQSKILKRANIQFHREGHTSRTAFLAQKRSISLLCINSKLKLSHIYSF